MTLLHKKTISATNNIATNITANLEVTDQNLSVVVHMPSNSTIPLSFPTIRICIITTGLNLVYVVLPVGVDVLHAGS